MRSLNSLVRRNLSAHKLRSVLTALAIALGVGMVLAASIVGQAANQSATELSDDGLRVDLEIVSRDGTLFDETVLDSLRASPDVEQVSPSLRVEVTSVDPEVDELTLLGVEPESYAHIYEPELANGAFLDGPDTIVLPVMVAIDNGLNVGDEVVLASGERRVTLTVAGWLKVEQDIAALDEASIAYVPLEVAQTLGVFRDPKGLEGLEKRIDYVAVVLRSGARLDRAKADLSARLRDTYDDELFVVQAAGTGGGTFATLAVQVGLAMVGVIMLFAAAFVIANAFAMTITARTREIGALRALGMTRRQVTYTVLAEASLLGLIGAAAGVPPGIGLAWGVMRLRNTLDGGFAVPWWGVVASTAMGLVVTLIGALQPAWRASRVSPLAALRSEGSKGDDSWYVRRGGRAGGALLFVFLPGLIAAATILRPDFFTSFVFLGAGIVGALLGAVLSMPALVQPLARLARPLLTRWLGTPGRLAADNLTRNKLRTVLTAGALTVGLTTIIATTAVLTVSLKGGFNAYFGLFHEDGMIIPDIPALLASGEVTVESSMDVAGIELDPALVEAIIELDPGTLVYYGFAPLPPELSTMLGAPGVFVDPKIFLSLGNFDFFEGDADSALEVMRDGHAMLVMPIIAERLGVGVGDVVPVETQHGTIDFSVAGIGGTGTNFTVFSYADGEAYFGLTEPSWLGIVVSEGQDVEAVLEQVRDAIALFEDVVIFDMRDSGVGGLVQVIDQMQTMLNALLMLAVVVAGLGVVNTVVINVAERQREIALLRAVGAMQRQVCQSVVAEAATLGLMAALIATALGLTTLALFSLVFMPNGATSVGLRITWESTVQSLLPALRDMGTATALSLVFGPLVAALAAYYPARQAAAMDVVEATRGERVELERTKSMRREGRAPGGYEKPFGLTLALRNLDQGRTRTVLSILAVALGTATIVATSVTSAGVRSGVDESFEEQVAFVTDVVSVGLNVAGVMILVAAGFLIYNAFGMAVTQRQRQIGALRSLGTTRRQVMWLVLVEALVTGGLGISIGIVAGPMLGQSILVGMRAVGYEIGTGSASTLSVALAAAMGLTITLLSVLLPARRATRILPLIALRPEMSAGVERVPPARVVLGMAMIVALAIYLAVAPPGRWTLDPWNYAMPFLLAVPWLGALLLITPALIGWVGQALRAPLARLWKASGSLMADNLRRGRRRVTITALTFAVSVMTAVGVTGVFNFTGKELLLYAEELRLKNGLQPGWSIGASDFTQGVMNAGGMIDSLRPEVIADVYRVAEGRAEVGVEYPLSIPEINAVLVPNYISSMLDLNLIAVPGNVKFIEGDLETALTIMEQGCGVLLAPGAAARNGVSAGDTLTIQSVHGPLDCTVAGVVAAGMIPVSFISPAVKEYFDVDAPTSIIIFPHAGIDRAALEVDLQAIDAKYGDDAWLLRWEESLNTVSESTDMVLSLMNSLLFLVVLVAALGTINTMVISVTERRRERVEAFLDESRNLFRLTGIIALLAGVLLAQAIGGVVTVPERELVVDTRQAIQKDLDIKFDPKTRDELTILTAAYNQMVIGLREREWLRDMFGRFVSREVAEAIRSGQVRLEGENRVVSVLFCDIRGFTARSERHTPEEMVALLNEYLPVVVKAAQEHEGTVNKFGGDSTLVIYGAPRRLQESAYQAVLTALEMRTNLVRLNERLAERGEPPIRIGVGINTGMALAGAIGPEERQEYTVIGNAVTLASQIEGLNKMYPGHDILVSGWTYEALGSRRAEFTFADLGEVPFGGKAEPVRIWLVNGRIGGNG